MRFKQREGRPLPMEDMRGCAWKKKTPAQRRRDALRAGRRQQGEQKYFGTISRPKTFECDVAKAHVSDHDDARSSRPDEPTDYVTVTPLTSDPRNSPEKPQQTKAAVSNIDPPPSHSSDTQEDSQSASSGGGVTAEDVREMIKRIFYQPMSQPEAGSLHEHTTVVCSGTAEASPSNSTTEIKSAPIPPEGRAILKTSSRRTPLRSPSRPPEDNPPAALPGSADSLHSKINSVNKPERSRTPPSRKQPARATRKT